MNEATIGYWLTWIGTSAWGVCFWWMHRISSRQDKLLDELREQAHRIEELSRIEHDILKEVHPRVDQIRDVVHEVTQDLADVRRDNIAQAVMTEQVAEQVAKIEEVAEKMARVEEMVAEAAEDPGQMHEFSTSSNGPGRVPASAAARS